MVEAAPRAERGDILGTVQYTAPECFAGERGTSRSDFFSLGVVVYQMVASRLPCGAGVARTLTSSRQSRLRYVPTSEINPDVPRWVDEGRRPLMERNPVVFWKCVSAALMVAVILLMWRLSR